MATITFKPDEITIGASDGEALSLVAARAGIPLRSDCGGQGVCRRCAVILETGQVRVKGAEPTSADAAEGGVEVLACQSVLDGDVTVRVPDESRAAEIAPFAKTLGAAAERLAAQTPERALARRLCVTIPPPAKGDSLTDLDRLVGGLRSADPTFRRLAPDLATLRTVPNVLRDSKWSVCATVVDAPAETRLVHLAQARDIDRPTFGLAIDIGTSTVAVALVSLQTGRIVAAAGKRNQQIRLLCHIPAQPYLCYSWFCPVV